MILGMVILILGILGLGLSDLKYFCIRVLVCLGLKLLVSISVVLLGW